ncbi:FHA domain containing protein [Trichomonas vaginalis G3]|uniref:E3 ubiquitin-protein ligase CHFR n=1 Tax=Trichomonas vaginalis (strain ATCC PRA-98 / G3) TaxID=412133 RepID=A2E4N8_TRIV3|nr:SMAD/FHA domain family [Trichomonas vaginalis G3]EAY12348.1 FHA domain containing protein [Trichomonas vaginalis G3]KAI5500766.1 SMAD/FHA domain family [Trichomonas vaginalis G3]|eukprot:XP_001324571.1 FHA domain containing protein [Trichomonas vaginalis G3]
MGIAFLIKTSTVKDSRAPIYIALKQAVNRIGRHSEIRIDTEKGQEISKLHTTIYRRVENGQDCWIIEDNESLNGTFVNKRKIHRVYLNNKDEVVFGGGSNFCKGDFLESTDNAPCRYIFYTPFRPIKFLPSTNINQSIRPSDDCELCPICFGPLTASETLPCGHTFCLTCIHQWADQCLLQQRPCVCPMCRATFLKSQLSPEEAIFTENDIQVITTEPFLRELEVQNCKKIKAVNIFKQWDQKHAIRFWNLFSKVSQNMLHRAILLQLVKLTPNSIFAAKNDQLQIALQNLTGNVSTTNRDPMIQIILTILALKFMPSIPSKPRLPSGGSKSARFHHNLLRR